MRRLNMKTFAIYAPALFLAVALVFSAAAQADLIDAGGNVTLIRGSAFFPVSQASDGLTSTSWVTNGAGADYLANAPAPILVFDLGEDVLMDGVAYCNYALTNANGVSQFSLRFATAADGSAGFGKSVFLNPRFNVQLLDPSIKQELPFGTLVTARYIEMTCEDNFYPVVAGGDRVGFAELQFNRIDVPYKAWNPAPAIGAKDVGLNVTLRWNSVMVEDPADPNNAIPDPSLVKHVVYMSSGNPADPNVVLLGEVPAGNPVQAQAQYGPLSLARDKTYYWRVDEVTDANTITGDMWNFQTLLSVPVIDTEPADTSAFVAGSASFTVAATNPFSGNGSGLSYQWYKVGTPDTAVGTDSPTLTITNVQVANEGQYHCIVTITTPAVGTTATTRKASLLVRRIMGHWPFDGDITDIVGGIPTVTQTGNPAAFDTGIVGTQAIKMVAGTVNPVVISTPAWAQIHSSWTISVWENMPATAPTSPAPYMMASGTDATGIDRFFFWRYSGGLDYEFRFYRGGTILLQLWGYGFAKDQWHLVTVTYDALTDTGNIYVDGVFRQSGTVANYDGFAPQIFVGNRKNLIRPYEGRLDDLRLYNYPLDRFEVAGIYTDGAGGVICVENPTYDVSGPAGAPDCVVNLYDLVAFVGKWLEHGFYPYKP